MVAEIGMKELLGIGITGTSGVVIGTIGTGLLVLFVVALIWSFIWKGIALWKSARKSQTIWFIILLIVNTVGILEILYIFIFSKMKSSPVKQAAVKKKKRR